MKRRSNARRATFSTCWRTVASSVLTHTRSRYVDPPFIAPTVSRHAWVVPAVAAGDWRSTYRSSHGLSTLSTSAKGAAMACSLCEAAVNASTRLASS